jgi:hypothetical protein
MWSDTVDGTLVVYFLWRLVALSSDEWVFRRINFLSFILVPPSCLVRVTSFPFLLYSACWVPTKICCDTLYLFRVCSCWSFLYLECSVEGPLQLSLPASLAEICPVFVVVSRGFWCNLQVQIDLRSEGQVRLAFCPIHNVQIPVIWFLVMYVTVDVCSPQPRCCVVSEYRHGLCM